MTSIRKNGCCFSVQTGNEALTADAVMVCTGGVSYPSTGSTGDGYSFARSFGLKVIPPRPALCGIVCGGAEGLQGVSLKNVRLNAEAGGKSYSFFGEMLFTHFGISGPVALTLSSYINDVPASSVRIWLDLKPALDENTLDKRILRDFAVYINKRLGNALVGLLPKALILPVIRQAGVSPETPVNMITKEQRGRLVQTLKHYRLLFRSLRPAEEGIVTAGGVDVGELDPRTMESRKVPGLYFCGEAIDVDALTGGFNLQTAFMTGFAAGRAIH